MKAQISRRKPVQDRAVATVDAILTATSQVLVEEGYMRASTNRIAKRAGVSVGTLYQYFPNKETLIERLIERICDEQVEAFARDIQGLAVDDPGLEVGVRSLIDGVLAMKRVQPALSRVLILEAPKDGGRLDIIQRSLRRCRELVRAALRMKPDEIRADDSDLMTYVIVTSVFAVLEDAVEHRPELLADDALADELAKLTLRYLIT